MADGREAEPFQHRREQRGVLEAVAATPRPDKFVLKMAEMEADRSAEKNVEVLEGYVPHVGLDKTGERF